MRLRQGTDPMTDPDTIAKTAAGDIDITRPETCLIGFAVGNQMSDDTFGSCAYVNIDQADFIQNLKNDWEKVKKNGAWYTFFVYDMTKLGKNTVAGYE